MDERNGVFGVDRKTHFSWVIKIKYQKFRYFGGILYFEGNFQTYDFQNLNFAWFGLVGFKLFTQNETQ